MGIIKNIALKKSLKKSRIKTFIFLNEASSVIFLVNNDEQLKMAKEIAKSFDFNYQLLFFELNNNNSENFCKKDVDFFFRIKSDKLKSIVKSKFDVLINLTCEDNFFNYFISNIINANFKVGASCYDKELIDYDFTLELINNTIDDDWKGALINNLSKKRIL